MLALCLARRPGGAGPRPGLHGSRGRRTHALPYTNAVLHEVQRFITLLPHAPRCTVANTQLGPYFCSQGARARPPPLQTLPPLPRPR